MIYSPGSTPPRALENRNADGSRPLNASSVSTPLTSRDLYGTANRRRTTLPPPEVPDAYRLRRLAETCSALALRYAVQGDAVNALDWATEAAHFGRMALCEGGL